MKCSKCGTEMTALDSYRCPSCGRMTCLQHRMPDRHDCGVGADLGIVKVESLMKKPEIAADKPVATDLRPEPQQPRKKRFGLF